MFWRVQVRVHSVLKQQRSRTNDEQTIEQEHNERFVNHTDEIIFTLFLRRRNGVCQQVICSFVHSFVRPSIRPSRNVQLYTAKQLHDLFFAHMWMLTRYVRLPFVIHIANVLDLHFQRFKSSTLGSSNLIIKIYKSCPRYFYTSSNHFRDIVSNFLRPKVGQG